MFSLNAEYRMLFLTVCVSLMFLYICYKLTTIDQKVMMVYHNVYRSNNDFMRPMNIETIIDTSSHNDCYSADDEVSDIDDDILENNNLETNDGEGFIGNIDSLQKLGVQDLRNIAKELELDFDPKTKKKRFNSPNFGEK